jgi:hypothetical protein
MSPSRWFRPVALAGLVLAACFAMPAWTQGAKGKKYALLVGVTNYQSSHFTKLKYTENDVEELAKLLNQPSAGFAKVRVLTNSRGRTNPKDAPTAANIRQALSEMLGAARSRHDLVLLALSGHGIQVEVKDPEGEKEPKSYTYFCPTDASLSSIRYSTGYSKHLIPLNDTFEAIGRCDAGTKLVLMDACRNELEVKGETRSVDPDRVTIPRGVGALFSCKAGQRAFETRQLGAKGHGVFFYHVLEGLRGKAKNDRGEVTWSRLTDYVIDTVPDAVEKIISDGARQEPNLMANIAGRSPVLAKVSDAGTSKPGDESVIKPKEKRSGSKVGDAEIEKTFRELLAKSKKATRSETIRLGLWIDAPLSRHDLEALRQLAAQLGQKAAVVRVAVTDKDRVTLSRLPELKGKIAKTTGDLVNQRDIDTIVFIGLFRGPRKADPKKMDPTEAAMAAGADVFVVIGPDDKGDWRSLASAVGPAMLASRKHKRIAWATIPKNGVYTSDFAGFYAAVLSRNWNGPGAIQNLAKAR